MNEFFGIEARGIARITSSLGDLAQKGHRGIIGRKHMQPPSVVRVDFHTVEELAVTVCDQCIPKALAIVINRLTVGVPGLRSAPPVPMRRGSREAFLGRLELDSAKVGEPWRRVTGSRSWRRYLVGVPENAVPKLSEP
jgi:hypothetical protein